MEITANALQTVETNQDVLFTDVAVGANNSIVYRIGSGIVTLRGLTHQCRARFRVSFGANVAISEDGTVDDGVSLAIAVSGEPVATASMLSTPAAVSQFNNIFSSLFLDVPSGCCTTIAIKNNGSQTIEVENANLIIERVA